MFLRPVRERDSGERPTDQEESRQPGFVVKVCLVGAALLPWFAVFSGVYGLYSYVVLAAVLVAPWLLIPLLLLAFPLAGLLLVLMPAGAVYAAVRCPPRGWAGRLIRVGCLVSMCFAVAYGGLMVVIAAAPAFADGAGETFDLWLLWRAGVLVAGFAATWKSWRWLRRYVIRSGSGRLIAMACRLWEYVQRKSR